MFLYLIYNVIHIIIGLHIKYVSVLTDYTMCPGGQFGYAGVCYHIDHMDQTENYVERCQHLGMVPAVPKTPEDWEFITRLLENMPYFTPGGSKLGFYSHDFR